MGLLGRLTGKVRCPACTSFARHSLDREREAEIRDENRDECGFGRVMSQLGGDTNRQLRAMGITPTGEKKTVRAFVCGSCGHRFDLETEMIWSRIAKQTGDPAAAAEYRKLEADDDD
jgi:ribosomal protein L44E